MFTRKKPVKLDAAFCRHMLMVVGEKDMPSAGTLGAVIYKLKIFNEKAAREHNTARKLVEYLDRPEYRHHLSPAILTALEKIKTGAVKNTLYSAQLSPKIAKQLQLLYNVGLLHRGYLTPLGIQLFKDWPSLRATVSRHIQHAFARAKYAEQRVAIETKRRRTLEQIVNEKQREIWQLRNPR